MANLPKVTAVKAGTDANIRLAFKGNGVRDVNLRGLIARSEYLAPLNDRESFAKPK